MRYSYPTWRDYLEAHRRMLEEFGGYEGVNRYAETTYESILSDVKKARGVYNKGATLLWKLRTIRLVDDAQKRTAYSVTAAFLDMNGVEIFVKDVEQANAFMQQEILKSDHEGIVRWLRDG